MFSKEVYTTRREALANMFNSGVALFPGNYEAPYNYPDNTYHFRQDSSFLYYFGHQIPNMVGVVNFDTKENLIFADDVDINAIVWMGPQPLVSELGKEVGVEKTAPLTALQDYVTKIIAEGKKIHFLPPYRAEQKIQLADLLQQSITEIENGQSIELVKAVVSQREIKDANEIAEIEKAIEIAYAMQTTSMKMAHPGVVEQEIAGALEGISISLGNPPSFPIILSMNGETLHNHNHHQTLEEGRLMITDCGAETTMHYASDITRTVPVGGKFSDKQRAVYTAVLEANLAAIKATKPGIENREVHMVAAKTLVKHLIAIGLMKGDIDKAAEAGAHALFQPHGLGHMMGLDVHDMENFGEDLVGYDENTKRSTIFGHKSLRLGKVLKPGFVLTIEPGCYFIPALIEEWEKENKHAEFINYNVVKEYIGLGGIRIEDDILVTKEGHRVLGRPIPKTVEEIETIMASTKASMKQAVETNALVKIKHA